MARAVRQKQALARDLRESLIRAGACFGLLGALWWGVKHPEHVGHCSTHRPANLAIQHCTSSAIAAVAGHWAVIFGVGLGIGGAVGVALALLIPMSRRA